MKLISGIIGVVLLLAAAGCVYHHHDEGGAYRGYEGEHPYHDHGEDYDRDHY
jgi:hypothetical protein